MDFLDPKKKRAHKIRLYIGYGLVAVALAIATLILVFAAYGYDIDRKTGDIIQNGLVIVDAHPEPATVLVNGEEKGTTDDRLVLPADKYLIELTRAGYLPWKHEVNLAGSSIEQLVYPFMFPERLVTKNLQTYNGVPTMASESPDRKWLVVSIPETLGSFQVVDLGNSGHPTKAVALPADTMTVAAGAHTFEAVEWSSDNENLLVKHSFTGGVEFLLLNRDRPENSVNLNKLFPGQVFTAVSLRDKKADQFYLFNSAEGTIYTANSRTRSATIMLSKVLSYKTYEDETLLYATNPTNAAMSEIHVNQKGQDYILRTVPKSDTYLLDMAQFDGRFYLVAGSGADGRAYIYRNPFDDLNRRPTRTPQPIRVLITPGAEYVSFSAIARFVAVQGGSAFAVYDAETGRQFRYDTKLEVKPHQKATWMDGHRLMLNSKGYVQVFDFDGTNLHQLSASSSIYTPFFDRGYTALFTLSPNSSDPAKTTLVRTELKVVPSN